MVFTLADMLTLFKAAYYIPHQNEQEQLFLLEEWFYARGIEKHYVDTQSDQPQEIVDTLAQALMAFKTQFDAVLKSRYAVGDRSDVSFDVGSHELQMTVNGLKVIR